MTVNPLYPTVLPTLNLDFANSKRLDPRITFTRASSATYVDASGVVQSAATNVPRFDHNPTTGESLGLLVEEARTNITTNSENIIIRGGYGGILQSNAGISPSGSFTATKLSCASNTGYHGVSFAGPGNFFTGTSQRIIFSAYVKPDGMSRLGVMIDGWGWSNPGIVNVVDFNTLTFSNVTVSDPSTIGGAMTGLSIVPLAGGWYRVSWSWQYAQNFYNATNFRLLVGTSSSNTTLGTWLFDGTPYAGQGFQVWGFQAETGFFPTSYIPTPATWTGRASTATFHDANGVLQTAASGVARSNAFFPDASGVMRPAGLLLEAAGTNLATYSEQFDTSWNIYIGGVITTNTTTAPDATLTADTLAYDGINNRISIEKSVSISPITTGQIHTQSFFVKIAGGNARYIQLWCTNGASSAYANFDLVANAIGSFSVNATPLLQKLANGWYRVGFSGITDNTNWQPRLSVVDSASASRNGTYGGSGASVFIWGAQLEASSFPTSYIPNPAIFSSRASTATYYDANGIIQTAASGVARSSAFLPDSGGVFRPIGLLLEAAGTNVLRYSDQLNLWNTPSNATITANATTAPDGTLTADKLVENNTNSEHGVGIVSNTTGSVAHTFSFFAKAGERSKVVAYLQFASPDTANFDLSAGTTPNSYASIVRFPNGWYRCSVTFTPSFSGNKESTVYLAGSSFSPLSYQGDGTSGAFIWGAQIEAGTLPTSYIPTVASTVTRAADISTSSVVPRAADTSTSSTITRGADVASITGTNFSSWHSTQGIGTIFALAQGIRTLKTAGVYSLDPGLGNAANFVSVEYDTRSPQFRVYKNNTPIIDTGTISNGVFAKTCISYSPSSHAAAKDGSILATNSTSGNFSVALAALRIGTGYNGEGGLNGTIARLAYYPVRLPDAQLQALTAT
jgi:hypothetical protein